MKQYLDLMEKIRQDGESRPDRTGTGTISLFGEQIEFDLADGFPLMTTKSVPFRWILVELLWFLKGRTNNDWLTERGVDIWDEWSTPEQTARFGRQENDLGPIYGHQWRNFGGTYYPSSDFGSWPPPDGVDQIKRLVHDLGHSPWSRRHIVSGWNPKEADEVALPPCHTLFQCYVHTDGRLDLKLYARSIDTFLGLPFNIASYALLLSMLAHHVGYVQDEDADIAVGLTPGRLIISFGDVHIYRNHFEQVERQLVRTPGPLPRLMILADSDLPLDQYEEHHIHIEGYEHQGKISAPVSV